MNKNRLSLFFLICLILPILNGCSSLMSSKRKIFYSPRNIGLKYDPVTLINKRNIPIKGWFIRSSRGAPCVIFCEGMGFNREYYLRFTKFLNEAGYNVFLFDYTGFGDSGGKPNEFEFHRFTEDINLAVDYVKTRSDVDSRNIALFGWSMGGGLALYTAANRNDIKAIIIDSSVYSFLDRFSNAVKNKYGAVLSFPLITMSKLYLKYDPMQTINKINNTPILFIHGTNDFINYNNIIKLYEKYNGPKRIIIFPYSEHMENFKYYKKEYISQVTNYLNIFLKDQVFNDFLTKWDFYDSEGKTIIIINNNTSDSLPIEIRINTDKKEYIERKLIYPGLNTFTKKTFMKPTSVITTRVYSDFKVYDNHTWDFFSEELSLLNLKFSNFYRIDNLIPFAIAAEDPEPFEKYADVVLKKNSAIFDSKNRYAVSSLILSNMMSEKTAVIAEKLYSYKNYEIIDAIQLFNTKLIAHPLMLENPYSKQYPSDPWGKRIGYDAVGIEQNIDGMYAMKNFSGKITGKSASIAMFNIALLRLMNIQPENIFVVQLKGSPEHTILVFYLDNEFYLFNNTSLLPGENISWPNKSMNIVGIYNDSLFLTPARETNFPDKYVGHFKFFFEKVFKDFEWNKFRTKKVEYGEMLNLSLKLGRLPSSEITNKVQKEVFRKSSEKPISQYTYAKYAFQSLLVKNLEVYAVAAKNNFYAKNLSKKFKNINEIISWMNINLDNNSIFNNETRLMQPDEVINYKTGNNLDKALLIWTFLYHKKIKSWIILAENDTYLAYNNNRINLLRMSDLKNVPNLKNDKIILLFNDIESYSKWTDVNRLFSNINQYIY